MFAPGGIFPIQQKRLNMNEIPTCKKCIAELIGTFWLVFGGCGAAVFACGLDGVGIGYAGVALAFGLRPYEELYDILSDPDEVHNLAYEPEYQQIRKLLSDKLEGILRETGDPRMDPGL